MFDDIFYFVLISTAWLQYPLMVETVALTCHFRRPMRRHFCK